MLPSASPAHFLRAYFEQFVELSTAEWAFFLDRFQPRRFVAHDYLERQDEICDRITFVRTGALMMVYERDGREFIRDFAFENSPVSVYESFISRQPATYALKAIADTTALVISYQDLQLVYKHIPAANKVANLLTEHIYLNISRRFESMITQTAEERYLDIINQRPLLLEKVPQYLVASYLGITDVALSRIRNRIAKKDHS